MEIRQLYYFLEVEKYKSFSKAAEHLYITQPTISQQIRALEKELGVALFRRTTKSVTLTKEGLRFLEPCREVVESYDRLLKTCDLPPLQTSTLRIGIFPFYKSLNFGQIINTFYKEHDDVNEIMKTVENNEAYKLLENEKLDFAILKCRDDVIRADMHYDLLVRENLRLLINRDNPCAKKTVIKLEELDALPLLTGEENSHYYQEMRYLYIKSGLTFNTKFQSTLDIQMMTEFIENDMGVLLVSDSAGIYSENEKIVSIPIVPPQEVNLYLVYPRSTHLTPWAREFRTFLLNHFKNIGV